MSVTLRASGPTFEDGLAAYRSNDFDQALLILESVYGSDPGNLEAGHVLALALRALGQVHEAGDLLAVVVAGQPSNDEAWSNYGAVLRECGRLQDAEQALEVALRIRPGCPRALNNLGTVKLELGDGMSAKALFEEALGAQPESAEALTNLSRVAYEQGTLGEARRCARSAIALAPNLAEAHNRLSFALAAAGDLEGSLSALRRAAQADPGNNRVASNFLLRAQGSDRLSASDLRRLAEEWGGRFANARPLVERAPRPLRRIGFVSADLRRHPVGYFFEPVLPRLLKHVDVYLYASQGHEDDLTRRLMDQATAWRNVFRRPAQEVARQIVDDNVDVLVDLSGHTSENRLDVFSLHPAPLQVSWLGYSGTTGLPQMDAVLTDEILAPAGSEEAYTERVLRLPDSFLCATAPSTAAPTKVDVQGVRFGVFNNPAKYSDASYRAWADILAQTPGSELLLKYNNLNDPWAQSQIRARFEDFDVEPSRIRFGGYVDYGEHLSTVAGISIALDTFPYSGATTTLDCLFAGVPVVTLAGDRYSSRMTASLLSVAGLGNTVATSEQEYVAIAVALGQDHDRLSAERALWSGRVHESALCDPERFSDGLIDTIQAACG